MKSWFDFAGEVQESGTEQYFIKDYEQLSVRYDKGQTAAWNYMNPAPRACFTPILLAEIKRFQHDVKQNYQRLKKSNQNEINYVVLASQTPGVFNLGGDLNLFAHHILEQDREHLLQYATACIEVLHTNTVNYDLPITTISLVEGSALGGGFEAALSSNILIAERNAEMGLPEILFNLFPGMGAYSLLARKVGMSKAEKIITSGKIYSAEELYEMGIIDVLAEKGEGRNAVDDFIRKHKRSSNGLRAIQAARQRYNPVQFDELMDITKIWVDAALQLTKKDLRMMQKLVSAQDSKRAKLVTDLGTVHKIRTKQDRRIQVAESFPLPDSSGNIIQYDRRKNRDRRQQFADDQTSEAIGVTAR